MTELNSPVWMKLLPVSHWYWFTGFGEHVALKPLKRKLDFKMNISTLIMVS